ncbi:hypothetical protein GCM10020254_21310 [Streptomyces goshikiensis]
MDFGLVLQTDPPASGVVSLMKRAERNGFRYGWTFDSAVLWQEPFVIYSQILAHTQKLRVGPMVTNPGTRTWEVTASTFATLNDMYGNRTVCGIGRGDSAMRVAGRKPNTLARLGEAIDVIRDLAEGREALVDGNPLRLPWVKDGELPVWMAAYGPKALALAGEKADGFILQLADPFLTEWMVKSVRDAAAAAGRDPAAITICVAAPRVRERGPGPRPRPVPLVRRDGRQPRRRPRLPLRRALRHGPRGTHRVRQGPPGLRLQPPRPHRKPLRRLRPRRDRRPLLPPGPGRSPHRKKLRALRDLGVDQFAVYDMHDAKEATIDAYGSDVIPLFS